MRKALAFSALIFLGLGQSTYADAKKEKKAMKEQMKKEMFDIGKKESIANLEQRIKHLQETKSCVSSASDGKALKKCRMEARKKGEVLRAEMKQKRKERMAKRKERMAKKQ
jgi:hypothetical protein